jgi:hypothetical protein
MPKATFNSPFSPRSRRYATREVRSPELLKRDAWRAEVRRVTVCPECGAVRDELCWADAPTHDKRRLEVHEARIRCWSVETGKEYFPAWKHRLDRLKAGKKVAGEQWRAESDVEVDGKVRTIECPLCRAAPLSSCTSKAGTLLRISHFRRARAWVALERGVDELELDPRDVPSIFKPAGRGKRSRGR